MSGHQFFHSRSFLVLTSFIVFAACTNSNRVEDKPIIKFVQDTLNFQSVRHGDSVKSAFHFTNIGQATLRILAVEAGCTCSVAKYPKKEFSPGNGDSIVVKYNSEYDKKGDFVTKTFIVQTNSIPSIHIITLQGLIN